MRTETRRVTAKSDRAEMSLEEIAHELGMTVGAVHATLTRGLRKLRNHGLIFEMKAMGECLDASRRE